MHARQSHKKERCITYHIRNHESTDESITTTTSERKHVQEFARKRVGIDAHGWLHRGIFSCASKICRGIDTNAYVDYCMHRVRMLIHFHVTPVLVFDGAELPMKADTHAERRLRREDALAKAEAASAQGEFRKAEEAYQRACPVTFKMTRDVIRQCRKLNVEYVVAPYEADAQLAWMMTSGYIDSVITEDSDLLVYGAENILYKMNKEGHGELYQSKNLPCLDTLSMNNFTEDMFMYMCVCSGCDFFKGVKTLGIRKAHPLVRRHRTLARITHAIRMNAKYAVKPNFTVDFTRACLVFRHQTVVDMRVWKTVSLRYLDDATISNLPAGVVCKQDDGTPDLNFLGRFLDSTLAKRLAEGFVHPHTLQELTEPLDIVERPLVEKPNTRPIPKANPSKHANSPQKKRVSGFFVQPASKRPSQSSVAQQSQPSSRATSPPLSSTYSRVPNLRQRLGIRSTPSGGFDPRLEARRFRMANGGNSNLNPRLAVPTSSVWEGFRPVSRTKEASSDTHAAEPSRQPITQSTQEETQEADEDNDEIATQLVGDNLIELAYQEKEPNEIIDSQEELRPTKRSRTLVPSSHKVKAVKRAVAKFATKSTEDVTLKFCANERPPSPDHESFKLFDQVDDEYSREAERSHAETVKPCQTSASKQLRHSEPGSSQKTSKKRAKAMDGKQQLRVSRFFVTKEGSKDEKIDSGSRNKSSQNAVAKGSPSAAVRHAMGSVSKTDSSRMDKIDNFRRGAAGKRIDVNDVSR